MDDILIDPVQLCEYAAVLKQHNVSCELHMLGEGGHGFGGCKSNPDSMVNHNFTVTRQWMNLFTTWANYMFTKKPNTENFYAKFMK